MLPFKLLACCFLMINFSVANVIATNPSSLPCGPCIEAQNIWCGLGKSSCFVLTFYFCVCVDCCCGICLSDLHPTLGLGQSDGECVGDETTTCSERAHIYLNSPAKYVPIILSQQFLILCVNSTLFLNATVHHHSDAT